MIEKVMVNHIKGSYDIMISPGLLEDSGKIMSYECGALSAFIVSDSNVWPLHGDILVRSLNAARIKSDFLILPPGENEKNLSSIYKIYNALHNFGITRHDLVIAFGGGVIGDMTGYAAATYMRGIRFVNIPTTLLAQVDSSIGGKTGVDLPFGKNLVGAFHQPSLVICDINTLSTLTPDILTDGMSEAVKHGCIADVGLFYGLSDGSMTLDKIIPANVKIKAAVVNQDEFEKGPRMMLNFGHTIGHAIEKYFNFTDITHGKAVALGMVYAAKIGIILGISVQSVLSDIVRCLKANNLPVTIDIDNAVVADAALSDKKRQSEFINFVFVPQIGSCTIEKVKANSLLELLGECDKIPV